eukprot:TRINITY_DN30318_c0_g1_i1.p1 TRINITY_DN30318_c0_g1~~TRINITY_DN30318_c0_g1_i1.p1  ORF type:complete len:463 (+),score=168.71 TRINITY_DN30318_c0_g1_i1:56-1444(+)
MTPPAKVDVVVFGATGDTGRCCAHFLFNNARRLNIASWAPALRNPKKLDALGDALRQDGELPEHGVRASPHIVADSGDYASLLAMAQQARVVVACAGPFELYGENVVKACVEAGTDYVDITGEVHWVNLMAKKYGEAAAAAGVSMLSQSAYDSVPSDITVALAAEALRKDGHQIMHAETHHVVTGAMPTGTLKTALGLMAKARGSMLSALTLGMVGGPSAEERAAAKETAEERAALKQKAGLVPKDAAKAVSRDMRSNFLLPVTRLSKQFTLPHFMTTANTPIVHATAAALGYASDRFTYRERLASKRGALSLYGAVPYFATMVAMASLAAVLLPVFVLFPQRCSAMVETLVHRDGAGRKAKVFDSLFNGFRKSGLTYTKAYASSVSGAATAEVSFKSAYDAGLGFTALSACTVAAGVLEKRAAGAKGRGFETAVAALGPDDLRRLYARVGVEISTKVHAKL